MSTAQQNTSSIDTLAKSIRGSAQYLANTPLEVRQEIILAIADALVANQDRIVEQNKLDIDLATTNNVSSQLIARLKLTPAKLENLAAGLRSLVTLPDPLNKVMKTTIVGEGLTLTQKTVPIGVVLIIFESRPDALVQIATLTLYSGNGVILKGGSEAQHSNTILHTIIQEAMAQVLYTKHQYDATKLSTHVVSLVHHRNDIKELLQCNSSIDLVIPRGSNALVSYIQSNTTIPVMGHSEGVCHIYLDNDNQDQDKINKIIVDAKTNYPSACNAMEMLVVHKDLFNSDVNGADPIALQALEALQKANVELFFTPELEQFLTSTPTASRYPKHETCTDIHREYGDLQCSVHVVGGVQEAIDFINSNSSRHTECIISDNGANITQFLNYIDSASVYANASTRFADGQRYGMGCEIGISTSRIHARGPVGLEGLVTYKWTMVSDQTAQITSVKDSGKVLTPGHTVGEFEVSKDRTYLHQHQ